MIMKNLYLELIHGDTWQRTVNFTDDAGAPLDISGSTLYFTVKDSPSDSLKRISKVVTAHTSPILGETLVEIATEDWADCPAGQYEYDMQISFSDGRKFTVLRGIFSVIEEITTA